MDSKGRSEVHGAQREERRDQMEEECPGRKGWMRAERNAGVECDVINKVGRGSRAVTAGEPLDRGRESRGQKEES